jgi:hypothetical protein
MSDTPPPPQPIRVIPEHVLRHRAATIYERTMVAQEEEVLKWLMETNNGRIYVQVSKWLNKALQAASQAAIQQAVRNRTWGINFGLNIEKVARKMHANVPAQHRGRIPLEMLVGSLTILAERSGYLVENGKIVFELNLEPDFEDEAVVTTVDGNEQEAAPALEGDGAPSLPGPGADDFEDLESEMDADDEGDVNPFSPGFVHHNGKGIHRHIDNIENNRVFYTVTQSASTQVKVGSKGEVSLPSFVRWSKGTVG